MSEMGVKPGNAPTEPMFSALASKGDIARLRRRPNRYEDGTYVVQGCYPTGDWHQGDLGQVHRMDGGTRPLTFSSHEAAKVAPGLAYHGPRSGKPSPISNPAAAFCWATDRRIVATECHSQISQLRRLQIHFFAISISFPRPTTRSAGRLRPERLLAKIHTPLAFDGQTETPYSE
jgi:hypothetical protein